MFNNKYSDHHISNLSLTAQKWFREIGTVRYFQKSGKSLLINNGNKLVILIDTDENPHKLMQ